jgi:hypothetical protein
MSGIPSSILWIQEVRLFGAEGGAPSSVLAGEAVARPGNATRRLSRFPRRKRPTSPKVRGDSGGAHPGALTFPKLRALLGVFPIEGGSIKLPALHRRGFPSGVTFRHSSSRASKAAELAATFSVVGSITYPGAPRIHLP